MILTILSHMDAVTILFVVGIALIVVPIFLYKVVAKNSEKLKKVMTPLIICGSVCVIPMCYYFYLDIRYGVGSFSLNDRLYLAVENKNFSAAQQLIKDGAEGCGENRYGRTALYRAVLLDENDLIRLILENGADPNYIGNEQITCLGEACRRQNIEAVKILLEYGADPDYLPEKLVPAIHYAAANDEGYNAELIRLLIDGGANPVSYSRRDGKRMLPFRFYFDKYYREYLSENGVTPEEKRGYREIKSMLYRPYMDWLVDKLISEEEGGEDIEAVP